MEIAHTITSLLSALPGNPQFVGCPTCWYDSIVADFDGKGSIYMNKLVIGILAHVDAGKTSLSESLLYLSGRIRKFGRVDKGSAFLIIELERARGITIFSKQAVFEAGDFQITLLDTPGHVDFSAEMERTLQVLDYAILVVKGDGVQGIPGPCGVSGYV